MVSGLLEELKVVTTEVKISRRECNGRSRAAMAVEEHPQRRGVWTLLVEAGAEIRGRRGGLE